MIPNSVERLLGNESESSISTVLDDESIVFWVDFREEDDAIVEYCESVLNTDMLSAELVDIEEDPGVEIYIDYSDKRLKVPLVVGLEDRHTTLHTLNLILAPDYEIRVCVASNGSDALAFLPLSTSDWSHLESQYGERVSKHFRKITENPNLFTEPW